MAILCREVGLLLHQAPHTGSRRSVPGDVVLDRFEYTFVER
jgi:hypothetical protein